MFAANNILHAFNYLLFPDQEDELPEFIRKRPHINLGYDEEGNSRVWQGGPTSTEFWAMFGFDAASDVRALRVLRGQVSFNDYLKNHVKSFRANWANQRGPWVASLEALSGISLFPDPAKPRRIRDRWEALFDIIQLGDEYAFMAGKPNKLVQGYTNELLMREYKWGENAYFQVRDIVGEYRTGVLGKSTLEGGLSTGLRSEALAGMRDSIRYGDLDNAEKYMTQYLLTYANDPDPMKSAQRGLEKHRKARHPLGSLAVADVPMFMMSRVPEEDQQAYLRSLPSNVQQLPREQMIGVMVDRLPEDKKAVIQKSIDYYNNVLSKPLLETYVKIMSPKNK